MGSNVPPRTPHEPANGRSVTGPSTTPRRAFPLELDPADPDGVAGRDAGSLELALDAELGEVSLEPLRRLLVLEVRLRREPLDAATADAERAILALDSEPEVRSVEAMDHDTGRLPGSPELIGVGQQAGERRDEGIEPFAGAGRDADDLESL